MTIQVYTDGSATISSKPGGYGWVLVVDGVKHSEGNGHIPFATNNDAELAAAIYGLAAAYKLIASTAYADKPAVVLISDSQIILNWANGTHRFKQVDKMQKYESLRALMTRMNVKTEWCKGHAGNEHNERCDKLANMGRKNQEKEERIINNPQTLIGTKKDGVFSIWYKGQLKVIDLSGNIVENYDKQNHGKRDSKLEIK